MTNKSKILFFVLMLGVLPMWAQLTRSDAFHSKYKLNEVFVFSRHNIRAPMSSPGSFISQVTPYTWYDFGVAKQELTMKGGILETTNGQFFHQWVVKEGLFQENAEPSDAELYVLSNSKQRTISTARHFAASFMPMQTVEVHHEGKINDMDANFTLNLGTDITPAEWKQIKAEYDSAYSAAAIRKACEELKPNFELLTEVLNVENSSAYKDGSFKGFTDYNDTISYAAGAEPAMKGILNQAGSVVDALILQYYEEPDLTKVAFGKDLTRQQWQMIAKILAVRDEIRFSSPFVQRYVSKHQRQYIADALQTEGRKFTFMCGHDTNIHNLLKALQTKDYETTNAIEYGTPIGSKIVFEKWVDASGNAFIAVNHVYQTVEQLRNNTLLNLTTPPNIIPLEFEGLEPNADGLIPMDKMIQRLTDADHPTGVNKVSTKKSVNSKKSYTVNGTPVPDNYRGIIVQNDRKYSVH